MATIQTIPHSDAVSRKTKHINIVIFMYVIHSILDVFESMVVNADLKKEMYILDAIREFITHEEVHCHTKARWLLTLIEQFVRLSVVLQNCI